MNDTAAMQDPTLGDGDASTAAPGYHEHYPWCRLEDEDRLIRSFVFEATISLEIKDKLQFMKDAAAFIKAGDLPQKLTAVK